MPLRQARVRSVVRVGAGPSRHSSSVSQIRHLHIPQYENLSVEAVLEFCKGYPEVFKYLPPLKEAKKVQKAWLMDVIFTVVQDPFGEFVKE